eukprot:TRINITY_DN14419_c0_g1_i1.p1 TRINITY_DN14419_c0_g1~~TRINITY_DN14419_c0_g1_i1.p1  ORF type:complete len:436 (-),score=83.71 TRINITY_DN14419_c0_g1_i1:202-1509(-)
MSALRTLRTFFKKDKSDGSGPGSAAASGHPSGHGQGGPHPSAADEGDPMAPPDMFSESASTRVRYKVSDFEPIGGLGKGSFGHVFLVRKRVRPGGAFTEADLQTPPTVFAMKVISKQMVLDKGKVKDVFTERAVLFREGTHPFVVNLYFSFHNDAFVFFVMDNGAGGDFASYLSKMPSMRMDEQRAKMFCAEVFIGLTYLHKCGVMYRDLKPENILISDTGHAMLCDFGLSKVLGAQPGTAQVPDDEYTGTFVGSPYYVAPDVLRQTPYTWAVDWWSFGVLVYHVLCGRPPFGGRTMREIFQKILFRELMWPQGTEEFISAEARHLCARLLDKDPAKRAKEEEVRKHPWFRGVDFGAIKAHAARGGPSLWADIITPAVAKPLTPEDHAVFEGYEEPSGGAMVVDGGGGGAPAGADAQFAGFSQAAPLPTQFADDE